MSRFAVVLVLLALYAAWQGEPPTNLDTGDLVMSTACRVGFTEVTGSARPGIAAPPISEGAAPTFPLSAGTAVHVPVTLAGYRWCRADIPSNLDVADIVISDACRGGFAALPSAPGITGSTPSGPPLSAGSAATAPVLAEGKVFCRIATVPANLQAGDMMARTDCRDWQPADDPPHVQTARMTRTNAGYSYANTADEEIEVSGRLWCEL